MKLKKMLRRFDMNRLSFLCLSQSVRQKRFSSTTQKRETLVILGSGWSSYSVLKSINKDLFDVVVVSPRNHFLFTPLLASTTVGTLEFRSVIEPIRFHGFRQSSHFNLAYSTKLDTEKQLVECTSVLDPNATYKLNYDYLVIGVGALTNTFGVPGVKEHAFFLKEIKDARKIRNQLLSNFELSLQPVISESDVYRLLHVVIVGGGPTGVEVGAEFYDFLQTDVQRLYKDHKDKVRITLVEGNEILASFDDRLKKYAKKKMEQRKGFQFENSTVTEVTKDHVKLSNGKIIPCGLVVWSTGLSPRPFTETLKCSKNKAGQILTDRFFRVKDYKNVFAIGDCSDIEEFSLPCTAQVAEREGRYLAKFLNSGQNEEKMGPFKFTSLGMLAYIGQYEGLSDTPRVKMKGVPSWFLWRSAYLTRLGSWRLRFQVPMDWSKTILFGRDISRFD